MYSLYASDTLMRLREIDILKGVAMLLVMLGHSYLQVPFDSLEAASWSRWLNECIYSFHMPLFFVVSGFLYNGGGDKPTVSILKNKAVRLLIPYLCVTITVMLAKLMTPSTMTTHALAGDVLQNLKFIFVDCGNRWFVYILFWTFMIAVLLRDALKTLVFRILFILATLGVAVVYNTDVNIVDYTLRFVPFFVAGMCLRPYYDKYVRLMSKKWFYTVSIIAFFVVNVAMIPYTYKYSLMRYVIMPISGINMAWGCCLKMRGVDSMVMHYLLYVGRYSLQFYLLLFPVAVVGYLLGVVMQMTDVFAITVLMFAGQVIGITFLVEVTRRIKMLKYPLGY